MLLGRFDASDLTSSKKSVFDMQLTSNWLLFFSGLGALNIYPVRSRVYRFN